MLGGVDVEPKASGVRRAKMSATSRLTFCAPLFMLCSMSPPSSAIEELKSTPEGDEGAEGGALEALRRADVATLEALRRADVATLEALQLMALDFATWLHRKAAEAMVAGGGKAPAALQALSNGFNRAARTVRLIMILKEEAAGLRPVPQRRTCVANQNGAGASGTGASGPPAPVQGHYGRGFRSERERRDWEEQEERRKRERDESRAYIAALKEAVAVDAEAAGPEFAEWVARESAAVSLTTIADQIPHPTLDAALARVHLERLQKVFRRQPGQGPP